MCGGVGVEVGDVMVVVALLVVVIGGCRRDCGGYCWLDGRCSVIGGCGETVRVVVCMVGGRAGLSGSGCGRARW